MKRPLVAAMLALALPGVLRAQDPERVSPLPVGVSVTADLVSTYVFRGLDITGGPAFQPSATLSLGSTGLSVTASGSFALTGRDRLVPLSDEVTRGGSDELDFVAAFARPAGPLSLEVGYSAYYYPSSQQDYVTHEVYGTVGLDSLPLAPALAVYYELGTEDPAEGFYASLEVSRSVRAGLPLELDLGASLGYTNQEALRPGPGFHDASVSLGTDLAFGRLTVTPGVTYSRRFGGSAFGRDDVLWAAVQATMEL